MTAEELLNTLSKEKWERIGPYKRAGVLIPLFSVYSKYSLGIGDFADIRLLVDWCWESGHSILQFLPMNEVGATFCPYDAISSFAIEPAYISIRDLIRKDDSFDSIIAGIHQAYPAGRRPRVDYGIKDAKERLLYEVFKKRPKRMPKDFQQFKSDNEYWLDDFTLFKALKHHYRGKPWYEWEDEHKVRDLAGLKEFAAENGEELEYHKWAQWVAFKQFKEAKEYAASKEIFICGDMPILPSRDSADVWAHPELFKLEYAAGAPPDAYCSRGQRWGMPTYDWEAIEQDGYRYIVEKLETAENFFDILRIDHVVGFFRIWTIPYDSSPQNEGLYGFFDPKDENTWRGRGKEILKIMLASTKMLLCGEDLGMIPKLCPETLAELGIPGNDVQRWSKDWVKEHDFLRPGEFRLASVAMLSTHDTSSWASWWEHEVGTVDGKFFERKCYEKNISFIYIKNWLFRQDTVEHGSLRWLDSINSVDMLVHIIGKRKEEIKDMIELYENTYDEKEKLWHLLQLKGRMRELCDSEILEAAIDYVLKARSIFCVNLITDYLIYGGILKGDPRQYRINRPGTVSKDNWSFVMPVSLEELLESKLARKLKSLIDSASRI